MSDKSTQAAEAALARFRVSEAAAYLGLSVSTLNKARCAGRGPRYVKVGGRVFYRRQDIDEYLRGRLVETTDSRASAA